MVYGARVMLSFAHMIKDTIFSGGGLESWWISFQTKISDSFAPFLAGTKGVFPYLITCTNIAKMYEVVHSNFTHVLWFVSVILILDILSNLINIRFSAHHEENLKKLLCPSHSFAKFKAAE